MSEPKTRIIREPSSMSVLTGVAHQSEGRPQPKGYIGFGPVDEMWARGRSRRGRESVRSVKKGGKLHKCRFVSFSRTKVRGQAEKLLTELLAAEFINTPDSYAAIWIKT